MGIFNWLFDLLGRLWKLIKKILPYILLAMALYLAFVGPILFLGLQGVGAALGLAGASFLFAPGETAEVFSKAVAGVGDAAQAVVTEAGDLLGAAVDAVLSGTGIITALVAAGVVWWLLSRRKKEKGDRVSEPADPVGFISDASGPVGSFPGGD